MFKPPNPDFGDFSFVVNQVARDKDPQQLAEHLQKLLEEITGIASVNITQQGGKKEIYFLNFVINNEYKSNIRSQEITQILTKVSDSDYGFLDHNKGKSVVVEHTSANPISTLHIGNLRNSVQGDTYARILERTGYKVYRHFYVNDVGLQISFVVIGYEITKKLGMKPPIKIDVWLGQIYAIMNCFYTIQTLKKQGKERGVDVVVDYNISSEDYNLLSNWLTSRIDQLQEEIDQLEESDSSDEQPPHQLRELKRERKQLQDEISDLQKYVYTFDDLKSRFPDLFEVLYSEVKTFDLKEKVSHYLQSYEQGDNEEIKSLFREVVDWNLEAFEWTLKRYNIEFDQFDYESELTWSGFPNTIIDKLAEFENATVEGDSVRYHYTEELLDEYCQSVGISRKDLPIKGNISDLQLRRSDGTALYAAKDIAYSIRKFEMRQPSKVYNVIGSDQILPQFQLLLPLHQLGMTEYAKNLFHYNYEVVDLRGRTMSGRLAQYITADDFYDETYVRARMAKRDADIEREINLPDTREEWQQEHQTLRAVTLASTRFPLVETDPQKRIELDLDRELDFRRNAGPFVEYAHARCSSMIKKITEEKGWSLDGQIDEMKITDDKIMDILYHLRDLDDVIIKAAENQDPSQVASWCFELAQQFMKFYERFPILKAETPKLGKARLTVVFAIKRGLHTGLSILGIPSANQL